MTETMLVPVVPTSEQTIVRRVLLDSGYALTAFVIAVPAVALVVAGVAAGLGTIVVAGIGLGVLVGTAYVARGFAHVERLRLRSMLGVAAPFPSYLRAQPGDSWLRAFLTPLRDVQTWLDVLWCLLALVTGAVALVVAGVAGLHKSGVDGVRRELRVAGGVAARPVAGDRSAAASRMAGSAAPSIERTAVARRARTRGRRMPTTCSPRASARRAGRTARSPRR
jgi:hypothetical protein